MNFKLITYLFFYLLLIYQIFSPQKQYIHTHCQIINSAGASLNQKNPYQQKTVDCISCFDVNPNPSDKTIKNGFIQIHQFPQKTNKTQLEGHIYLQSQCMEYECSQLQNLQDFNSKFNNKNLIAFGFQNSFRIQSKSFSQCQQNSFLGIAQEQKPQNCIQIQKQLINKFMGKKVYSMMVRHRYTIKQQKQQQPPSLYFNYIEYGFQASLIMIILALAVIFQSQAFFKDAIAQKYAFLGDRKNIMIIMTILTVIQYILFWNKKWITLLFNCFFLYHYVKIILDTIKINKTLSIIVSLVIAVFWVVIPIKFMESESQIFFTCGLTLTFMQLFFMQFTHQPIISRIMTFINIVLLFSSFMLIYLSPFNQMSKIFARNIPFLQIVLLIASYQRDQVVSKKENKIFLAHNDLQDLQLKINRQLGFQSMI